MVHLGMLLNDFVLLVDSKVKILTGYRLLTGGFHVEIK